MKEETKKKKKKKFASSFEGRIFLSTDNFTLRNEHTRGSSNACFDEGKTECLKKRNFGSRKLAEISKSGTNTLTTRSLYAVYTHTHTLEHPFKVFPPCLGWFRASGGVKWGKIRNRVKAAEISQIGGAARSGENCSGRK